MKQHKLNLASLSVESFETLDPATPQVTWTGCMSDCGECTFNPDPFTDPFAVNQPILQ